MIFQQQNNLPRKEENGKIYFLKNQEHAILFPFKKIRSVDETVIRIPENDTFHLFDDGRPLLQEGLPLREEDLHVR